VIQNSTTIDEGQAESRKSVLRDSIRCLGVVRGGGETIRRYTIALFGSLIVVMMLAQPVSAGSSTVSYPDRPDDLAKNWGITSLDPFNYILVRPWSEGSKVGQAGYCDILNGWLTHKGDSYVFGIEVAADLPTEGIIPGVSYVIWGFYAFFSNDGNDGLDIFLLWDGESYQAFVQDSRPWMSGGTWTYTEIPYTIDGAKLTLTVSARLFDIPSEFCWCFKTLMVMAGTFNPLPTDYSDLKGGTILWADLTDPQYATSPVPFPAIWYLPQLPSPK
jgi:hypothetical protein